MAQGGKNSKTFIIVGLVIVVAIIAYFVYGDGMEMIGGDTDPVTMEPAETTTGGTDGAATDGAASGGETDTESMGGGTTAPADNN